MAQPKHVNSLIRGLGILESFTANGSPLTLQDLSNKTGLPKTTVHRFLKTLLTMDYVTLDPRTKAYALAPRVMALGFSVLSGMSLRDAALPYMEALSRDTTQNVNLAILERKEMLFVERITVRRILNTNLHVGSRLNCYQTAVGRAFIAFLARDRYEPLLAELLRDRDAVDVIGRRGERLEAILDEVRRRGFAHNDDEWVPGLRAIGVPVFNERGEVEASLSMSFISQLVSLEEMFEDYVPRLIETANRISTVMGYNENYRRQR